MIAKKTDRTNDGDSKHLQLKKNKIKYLTMEIKKIFYFRVFWACLGIPKHTLPHKTKLIRSIPSFHQCLTTYRRPRQLLNSFLR